MENSQTDRDIRAEEEMDLTRQLHFHQIHALALLKRLSKNSPAILRSFSTSHETAERLRTVDESKLLTLAAHAQPATPLLFVHLTAEAVNMINKVHDDMSARTLTYASEYLSRRD